MHKKLILGCLLASALLVLSFTLPERSRSVGEEVKMSEETEQCVECHRMFNPGIVSDWEKSRHSRTSPAMGLAKPADERRISSESVPQEMTGVVVGCYECHGQNSAAHPDSFDHEGFMIHTVVTPKNCQTCHPTEVEQFTGSKKGEAVTNLKNNAVYHALVEHTIGVDSLELVAAGGGHFTTSSSSQGARMDTCFGCHGTEVKVDGMRTVKTAYGPLEVPNLSGWPNQGVGRINPDGSKGSCSACHARHEFSIAVARQPYTCAQCHLEPDLPAWDVYRESKHGNLYLTNGDDQTWDTVPWVLGRDVQMPTCAVCHSAGLVAEDGTVIAERSHDFGARLWVRIFGLIYSHPQPKKGDTTIIRNADGLPLPTTFAGEQAAEYLIDADEQAVRRDTMKQVCVGCHSSSWSVAFFEKMDVSLKETDAMVAAATQLMAQAWEMKLADQGNPFDEGLEAKWVQQWLFYANSVRYASAMSGPDYASFKNGWWQLSKTLRDMHDMIQLKAK